MQVLIFFHFGIETGFEARKYIEQAQVLLNTGKVSTPNFWLYSTEIFLIAAAIKLKTGFVSVVIVQLLFNALATFSLYKFCRAISNGTTALVVVLLFIFNFPLQTFNSYLQTESLFYSFTVLFSCYLLQLKHLTFKNALVILLFLLLISFTRPIGLLFIPPTFLYLFFRFFKGLFVWLKICITGIVTICFLVVLNSALGSGGELDFMLPFRDERIICGVPTLPHFVNIKTSDNPNSVFGLLYYIIHNPEQFLHMAWDRSKAFFGLFRSYYSFGHNLYLGIYFFPLYILGFFSLKKWLQKNSWLLLYCIAVITVNWITVILTCDDWHNRFFLSVAPYIYILAIPRLQKLTNKLRMNGTRQTHQS
jgi:hypothetical protein